MKTKLTLLLFFFSILMLGQEKTPTVIYLDLLGKKITDEKDVKIEKLKKGETYILKSKNYNPFAYKVSADITQKDVVKDIFDFFTGFLTDGKIAFPSKFRDGEISNDLVAQYIDAAKLATYVTGTQFIDCSKIPPLEKDKLLNSFINYVSTDSKYREANKLPEELAITMENVNILNTLCNKVLEYSDNKCEVEIVKFTPKKTQVTLNLKFTPINEKGLLNEISISETIKTQSRLYVDFSTGIMFTNIQKKQYYVKENSATDFKISEEEKFNLLPGVMGLLNIAFREEGNFKVNFGAGVDVDKTPHLLVGIGYNLFGKDLILSAGYDIAYIEKLTDKYNPNYSYLVKPEVAYKKSYENGVWFGISYKL